MRRLTISALGAILLSCQGPAAVLAAAQAEAPITRADRTQALDTLARRLDHYVFQERKPGLLAALAERREALLAVEDAEAFREAVNAILLEHSRDRHLTIWIARGRDAGPPMTPEEGLVQERRNAWGLRSVRRLPGNVGYLRLDYFSGHPEAGAAVDQAMRVLEGADALIIDLRGNGGGGEAAPNRLMGHLATEPLPMMTIQMRRCAPNPADPEACVQDGSRDGQVRFAERVERPAFPAQPIHVLTSARTFSAAEELAYDLQASGRGVVIGEQTHGGANPSATMDLGDRFLVIMPVGTTVHPATGTNWDADGVRPDVAVSADQALVEAYRRALATPSAVEDLAAHRRELAADPAKALRDDAAL